MIKVSISLLILVMLFETQALILPSRRACADLLM